VPELWENDIKSEVAYPGKLTSVTAWERDYEEIITILIFVHLINSKSNQKKEKKKWTKEVKSIGINSPNSNVVDVDAFVRL
jgi:hypothetical protein